MDGLLAKIKKVLVFLRRKTGWKSRFLLLILLAYLAFPYAYYTSEERYFDRHFKSQMAEGKKEIFIRDLTDFDWDIVCRAGYYSGEEERSNIEGYTINKNVTIPFYGVSDVSWGLAFVKDRRVFLYVESIEPHILYEDIPTQKIDNTDFQRQCLTIDEARIRVESQMRSGKIEYEYTFTYR